ncbi:ABC transporter ATP-binding protein [Rhodococcus sp. 1168]|uniref:ABC transporter ATP-binding protein n=1 Tax=Rhodococcus sp. 1168 TaxID=2018041 RepID=UPI000A0BF751|nr:ABC transporter ATP-binding protein [Rhodococcus sp. 1168]ORI13507.1 ABC transporter ATP-binding protein [Rhodococcus sp. 1168]
MSVVDSDHSNPVEPVGEQPAALQASSLYRFYRSGDEEVLALRGVSLQLRGGELVAVVGPSGSGKSTLLSCLAGLDEPDGGTVRIGGRRVSHQSEQVRARLRARHIGLLFQSGNLLAHLTVSDNIRLVQQLVGRRNRIPVAELLQSLRIVARGSAYPSELSGGELSRAGLAVALANDPDVILADEPTGELDSDNESAVLEILTEYAERGAAILVASHSPAVAETAHRLIRLSDGLVTS